MLALTWLWSGIAAFLTGQWRKASTLCERAAAVFRDHCQGVTWELNMAHNFLLGGLVAQGELRAVAGRLPALLTAAHERGNFYLELELRTRMILVWLAADDPHGAGQRADAGIARWSQRGFQRQHYSHLLARVQIALYQGRAGDAWQLLAATRSALRRSLLLGVQHTRIEAAYYRARAALAVAATGGDSAAMRRAATRHADRVAAEGRPWAEAIGLQLRGTLAYHAGDCERAIELLGAAAAAFDAADMYLYAAATRWRLGALVGGDTGRALRDDAASCLAAQDVRDPVAMTRVLAPGFPD
jgi:hypothetical protein